MSTNKTPLEMAKRIKELENELHESQTHVVELGEACMLICNAYFSLDGISVTPSEYMEDYAMIAMEKMDEALTNCTAYGDGLQQNVLHKAQKNIKKWNSKR